MTQTEVESLLQAAQEGKYPERDYYLFLMGFLHGFRVSELRLLSLDDIDIKQKTIYVKRLKSGLSTVQPLVPEEYNALVKWLKIREQIASEENKWVFLSQKNQPLSRSQIFRLITKYGQEANLTIKIHPHMLRHACGYALADLGRDTRLIQDYLGHRNIAHTVLYTASNEKRFNGIWD